MDPPNSSRISDRTKHASDTSDVANAKNTDSATESTESTESTENVHVQRFDALCTPRQLKERYPLDTATEQVILQHRRTTKDILSGQDQRLLVIVGPCSVHDYAQTLEYAQKLADLKERVKSTLKLHMRVYVDKPRTTIGWRGYLIDPHMDGSNDLNFGLEHTRKLMLAISHLGLPIATELLDPFAPQYLFDIVSWACLGARTTESQTHRVMASAVSAPMGFKNGTDGNINIAVNAITAARQQHAFLSIDDDAKACIVHTTGNPYGHVILRGAKGKPNFDVSTVTDTAELMRQSDQWPSIVIDCSHANSSYDHTQQASVFNAVLDRIDAARSACSARHQAIRGVMLESNLYAGKQSMPHTKTEANYGVSVTDACIGWAETEALILQAHERLA